MVGLTNHIKFSANFGLDGFRRTVAHAGNIGIAASGAGR
jgi:hypothetical protein